MSTPNISASGNMMPQSDGSAPGRQTCTPSFMPNSPRPPSGTPHLWLEMECDPPMCPSMLTHNLKFVELGNPLAAVATPCPTGRPTVLNCLPLSSRRHGLARRLRREKRSGQLVEYRHTERPDGRVSGRLRYLALAPQAPRRTCVPARVAPSCDSVGCAAVNAPADWAVGSRRSRIVADSGLQRRHLEGLAFGG